MGLFGRGSGKGGEGSVRTTALVIEAEAPPQGAPPLGSGSKGALRVLVDLGSGPVSVSGRFRFKEAHWLVTGMQVPITIDPARPADFEVDWEAVPAMEDRVAANDPALADPLGAGRTVAHALNLTQADTGTARGDRFREALEQASQASAPAGKLRAVALVVTVRGRLDSGGDPEHGSTSTTIRLDRNSNAVLSVNVPGQAPYAVFVEKFKYPRNHSNIAGGGLPALVSATDPADVEILWDEVPSSEDQLATRIADSFATAQRRNAQAMAMQQQIIDAVGPVSADAPAPIPAPGAAALPAMAPEMMQMAADSARRALQYVSDPAQRQMMIANYRAAGIILDDDPA